ncbi:hypothetical protein ACQKG8_25545, partial [Escherichia coli]|uniref:hypothetical protein n=1 Tax=Escherichia coli TaxID=562 RepID=UPI003CFE7774
AKDLAARPFRVGADPENPSDYDPNHPLARLATLDDRTRDDHAALDGTIIGPGETFSLDDGELEYPGDPNAVSEIDVGS